MISCFITFYKTDFSHAENFIGHKHNHNQLRQSISGVTLNAPSGKPEIGGRQFKNVGFIQIP